MDTSHTIVVIAGPTGVGKTDLALGLAERFHTSIISADSRQCYREMNIGVARPTAAELQRIPHYFIATHSVTEAVNAAIFTEEAQKAEKACADQNPVLVVGGTGLYIKAFTEGIDDIPPISEAIRQTVREGYALGGLAWLQAMVKEKDPVWYRDGEVQNPHRLMRALEVVEGTGASIRAFQKGERAAPRQLIKIGLDLPREQLYARIDQRVDRMMEAGLLEEVRGLLPHRAEKALDTVGYKELFEYLDSRIPLQEAVALIKQHTRNYAKRQLTWFRRDPEMAWFGPGEQVAVETYVRRRLDSF